MAKKIYTADELNKCDKETLAAIILALQDQVETLNQNMEKLIEQITAANNHRYGRKSEKLDVIDGQLDLLNIFNEPEILTECLYVPEQYCHTVTCGRYFKCKVCKQNAGLPYQPGIHTE